MTPLRTLVIDDEKPARDGICLRLDDRPEIVVVGSCADGRKAISAIERLRPDLVFLDIQMPEIDGFDVLRALEPGTLPLVLFVTAHDRHAIRAFEAQAQDYLLKPIDDIRFHQALDRAIRRHRERATAETAKRLGRWLAEWPASGGPTDLASARRLLVRARGRWTPVAIDEIDWVESDDDYVVLHVGSRRHLLRETLTHLAERLPTGEFVRVHRGALVRVDQVVEVQPTRNGDHRILLRDGTRLRLSRSFRPGFEAAFDAG